MAEIPRDLLDDLTGEVSALSESGQQLILNALENAEWETVEELRIIMVESMEAVCSGVTEHVAARAAEFYDNVRAVATGKPLGASVVTGRIPEATEGAIRGFVDSVGKTGDTEQLARRLAERVDLEAKRAANSCIAANCARDPLKPRYARVPTGADTCRFCIMLAANGFYYKDAEAAEHAHSGCDCRAVPGFEGMTVEGFDPEAYDRVWRRLESAETVHTNLYSGGKVTVEREAEKLQKQLNQAWEKHKRAGANASSYREHYATFVSGHARAGSLGIEDFTNLEGKELQVGSWLANAGSKVLFRNADLHKQTDGNTSDILLDGELFDFKRISSSNPQKIFRRITDKLPRQGPNFVADLSTSSMSRAEAEATIAWILEDPRVEQVLLVKSGSAKLFKK